jgi:hypothetical protein
MNFFPKVSLLKVFSAWGLFLCLQTNTYANDTLQSLSLQEVDEIVLMGSSKLDFSSNFEDNKIQIFGEKSKAPIVFMEGRVLHVSGHHKIFWANTFKVLLNPKNSIKISVSGTSEIVFQPSFCTPVSLQTSGSTIVKKSDSTKFSQINANGVFALVTDVKNNGEKNASENCDGKK